MMRSSECMDHNCNQTTIEHYRLHNSKLVRLWSDRRGDAIDAGAAQVPVLVVVVVIKAHPSARRKYPLHGVRGPLEDEDDLVRVQVRVRVGAGLEGQG